MSIEISNYSYLIMLSVNINKLHIADESEKNKTIFESLNDDYMICLNN